MIDQPQFLDARRKVLVIQGDPVQFAAQQFIQIADQAIRKRGLFSVALSGGGTPKAVYQYLYQHFANAIDWSQVHLFFSDERAVPPEDSESNFHMAMEAGFKNLPIPQNQIHRMVAERDREKNALHYEELINQLPGGVFDLMLLGMGNDGHTASLFPHSKALHAEGKLIVPNFIKEKQVWRMTVTYDCINHSRNIVVYIFGNAKKERMQNVFYGPFDPEQLPIQKVGTPENPALILLDQEAAPDRLKNLTPKGGL